ncbi:hypothetical protein [uncultured Corynebacterium sp.]|uniref:hypothetical protein n=1 Tax=uncultured Corynebacterium sp. TaxID=159447 RepID=UPI00260BC267|nr:hypothetical protein [uncultured Corynebacterium sp.]
MGANTADDEFAAMMSEHEEKVLAPLRQQYAEEREPLAQENRYKDLAVLDALERLHDIESSCSDDYIASLLRDVIYDLESEF